MFYWKFAKFTVLSVCFSCFAHASTLPDWMSVSGFASTAAAKSDNSAPYYYTRNIADEWCFDCDTILGIQLDAFPTDWLHFSVQGVKRPTDHFSDPQLEWAYLSIAPTTNFKSRIGTLRSPSFMYSQVVFVNQAYPWVRLPAEVYDTTSGFTRYDGIDATFDTTLSDEVLMQVQPYAAFPTKIKNNELNQAYYDIELKELYGLRLDFEGAAWSAYVNYFKSRVYIEVVTPQELAGRGFDITADTWSYGARYDWQDFTFVFEGTTGKTTDWGGYVSAIYHYDNWSPYVVYGKRTPGNAEGNGDKSDSISLGLRYDLLPNLSLVGEWHYTKVADDGVRGSFTFPAGPYELKDRSANIYTLGINYSFAL